MCRDTLSLLAFSLLAITAINGSYQWLDSHQTLDSRQALWQAQKIITQLNPVNGKKLKLTTITPPQTTHAPWCLEYKNRDGMSVLIQVQENGQASVL
jgi:hypothetical protein